MNRRSNLLRVVLALGAATALLAGCGSDESGGGGGGGDTGGTNDDSFYIMKYWRGCDVFDDLMPVREYMGVVKLKSNLLDYGLNEGLDGEAAGCSGLFGMQQYKETQGSFNLNSPPGDASLMAGLVPWATEEEAERNLQDRLDDHEENASGLDYMNEQEGKLGGEWDESHYITADIITDRHYIKAYGRYGGWIVYLFVDFSPDPGVSRYESRPSAYPNTSPEEMAVYRFNKESILDWIINDYMPQVQADVLAKLERER